MADNTDCDDSESTTNPGATEYCDGHDDDCNPIEIDTGDTDVGPSDTGGFELELQAGADQVVTITMLEQPALVQVVIVGPEGTPVEATFTVGDSDPVSTSKGRGELEVAAGNYGVTIRAEGFAVENRKASLKAGATELIEVELRPTQVELTVEKIEVKGEVYFDLAKATIKGESHGLLEATTPVSAKAETMASPFFWGEDRFFPPYPGATRALPPIFAA